MTEETATLPFLLRKRNVTSLNLNSNLSQGDGELRKHHSLDHARNSVLSRSAENLKSPKTSSSDAFDEGKRTNRWTPTTKALLYIFGLLTLALRLYRIRHPAQVVFDEVHFGGFASHYLKGTYFFDVHPPLGKLIIAGIGHMFNYKGTFAFKDIGDAYANDPTVPYVQMRTSMVIFGSGAVVFALATLIEMGFSPLACSLAGALLSFDNGLITQSKYILLDSMMFFFIFGSVYFWTKFRQQRYRSFSLSWWSHLLLTGIFLAGTVGVKLVGLFTVALIGFACLYDLWELADWRRQMSNQTLWRHFYARFACLAVIPAILYLSFYYVHFALLPLSGPGDGHMSTQFQQTLLGNKLHSDSRPVYYGQTIRISNRAERLFLHSHNHRIPQNHLDGKVSSNGQQVNGYPVADENNLWELRLISSTEAANEDPVVEDLTGEAKSELSESSKPGNAQLDKYGRRAIRIGDEVQVCHKATEKCLITHDVASPLTRSNMEITVFEEGNALNDQLETTHWIIEAIDASSSIGDPLKSLSTSFVLKNKKFGVRLMNFGKNLPPWGFGQRELNGCRKNEFDVRYHWNVADITDPLTEEEEQLRKEQEKKTVPMSFLRKFRELQVYSLLANSGLIDEHPFKSRPQDWILPKRGLGFWNDGTKARIFMMGNIVGWTAATFGVFVFAIRFPKDKFLEHRGLLRYQDHFFKRFGHKMAFLFGGYLIHYLPFYLMGRSLYLHHYLPAFVFSVLILSAQYDFMSRSWHPRIRVALALGLGLACIGAFVYLLPLVYGTEIESDVLEKRKFIKTWNF